MNKSMNGVLFLLLLVVLTSCNSAPSEAKPQVPEEVQLLDTSSDQTLFIGMKKSQIKSKKLIKDDEQGEFAPLDSYTYEGVDLKFSDGVLVFMHVTETAQEGRFKTRGLSTGSNVSELESVYGYKPLYNPNFHNYSYVISKDDLYYYKSLDEIKEKMKPELQFYSVDFNSDEKDKIRSFSIYNEKFVSS